MLNLLFKIYWQHTAVGMIAPCGCHYPPPMSREVHGASQGVLCHPIQEWSKDVRAPCIGHYRETAMSP